MPEVIDTLGYHGNSYVLTGKMVGHHEALAGFNGTAQVYEPNQKPWEMLALKISEHFPLSPCVSYHNENSLGCPWEEESPLLISSCSLFIGPARGAK